MIPSEKINDAAYLIANRFEAVNTRYIELMAEHVKKMGKLSATDMHRLQQMVQLDQNVAEINKALAKATDMSLKDIDKLYDLSGLSLYEDTLPLYMAKGIRQVPFEENRRIQNFIESMKRQTHNTFQNLSNTTSIQKNYRDIVDTAVQTVAAGTSDYNSEIRSILKQKAVDGMRVQYQSGLTRRLDSAVRMNILEGVRQLNLGVRQITGEEFGADGYEISVHGLCAPDHLPIQGRQFAVGYKDVKVNGRTYKSYEVMNNSLKRKIGTLNCKHSIFPIVLGISEPVYSEKQLSDIEKTSSELIDIAGKQYSRYECTQLMRKTETEMRYKKDEIIALEKAGIDAKKEHEQLNQLRKAYRNIGSSANLKLRYDRAYVPGYSGKQSIPKKVRLTPLPVFSEPNIEFNIGNKFDKFKETFDGRYMTETFENIMNKAPNKYKSLYNNYVGKTTFTKKKDGFYYDPHTKHINLDISNVDDITGSTVIHEIGHRILHDNTDIWDKFKDAISEAKQKDAESLMNKIVAQEKPEFIGLWGKHDWGYFIKEKQSVDWLEEGYRWIENYDLAEIELDKATNRFLRATEKNLSKLDDSTSYLQFMRVTDGVDGLFEGAMETVSFYGGHGKQYYNSYLRPENFFDELFANNLTLDILNNKDLIDIVNEWYPESRKLYEQVRDEIIKKVGAK